MNITRSHINRLSIVVYVGLIFLAAAACVPDGYPLVSVKNPGTTDDGLSYDRNDIIGNYWNPNLAPDPLPAWFTYFDGDAYGLGQKHRIGGFSVPQFIEDFNFGPDETPTAGELYLSFEANKITVPGIAAKVQGQDIVRLIINEDETYEYSLYFNGQEADLTTASEKIDAFTVWTPEFYGMLVEEGPAIPYDCPAGVIFLSTRGNYRVSDNLGGFLRGDGSDVLAFCAQNTGEATAGFWYRVWDSSETGLKQRQTLTSLDVLTSFPPEDEPIETTAESGNLLHNLEFIFTAKRPFFAHGGEVTGQPSEVFWGTSSSEGYFINPFNSDFNAGTQVPRLNGEVNEFEIIDLRLFPF